MQNVEAPKNAIERAMLKHDVKQAELGNSKSATESFPQSPYNENAMNMTYQKHRNCDYPVVIKQTKV